MLALSLSCSGENPQNRGRVACWEDSGETIAEASYSHADLDELDAGDSEEEAEEAGAGGIEGEMWDRIDVAEDGREDCCGGGVARSDDRSEVSQPGRRFASSCLGGGSRGATGGKNAASFSSVAGSVGKRGGKRGDGEGSEASALEEGDLGLFLIGEPSDTSGEGGGVGGGGGDGSGRALLNSVSSMELNVKDEHGRSRVVLAVLSLLALLVQKYKY